MEKKDAEGIRKHAAYHEAGHVIASLVYGHRFRSASIRTGESGEDDGAGFGCVRGRARDLAVVRLAGIAASAQMSGQDPGEDAGRFDDDEEDIADAGKFIDNWTIFLQKTYGEAPYRDQLWSETRDTTRQLVEKNTRAIEVIAEALRERGSLSYDEIVRVLKDQCPEFCIGQKP